MSIVAHAAAAPSRLTQPREAIASFRRRHAWWASTWVTVDLGLYLALLIAVVYTPPACRPLVSIALAFVIARLFVLGHDACHGSMFASRRANQIVGRLTSCRRSRPSASGISRTTARITPSRTSRATTTC